MADDHALVSGQLAGGKPAAFDHVLDADRLVVDRGDDQAADVLDAALFLARRMEAASSGLLKPSTLFTGSMPPPNRPTLRTVMATWPWST